MILRAAWLMGKDLPKPGAILVSLGALADRRNVCNLRGKPKPSTISADSPRIIPYSISSPGSPAVARMITETIKSTAGYVQYGMGTGPRHLGNSKHMYPQSGHPGNGNEPGLFTLQRVEPENPAVLL